MAIGKADMTHPNAQAFDLGSGKKACLLIHGFTGTPAQMRPLGEYLAGLGYHVVGIRLPGHGQTPALMEKSSWRDWLAHAEETANALRRSHESVYIGGLSMGGVISLILGERGYADAVMSYAAPMRIHSKGAFFSRFIWPVYRYRKWPPVTKKDFLDDYGHGYDATPMRRVKDLHHLMHMAEKGLATLTCPLLVVQSHHDETVRPVSADIIYSRAASAKKELLMLADSPHELTIGCDRERIFARTAAFLDGLQG